MKKTLRIVFNKGEIYEIDLKIIASLIANKEFEGKMIGNMVPYLSRINDL